MVNSVVAKAWVRQRHCFTVLFYELEAGFLGVNLLYLVHSRGGSF